MAWSRRRRWFVLALATLVLVAFVPMWLRPVSPLRDAYNQIRKGMDFVQVTEVLERCGWNKRLYGEAFSIGNSTGAHIETIATPDTLTYEGADGETLTIRCEGRPLFMSAYRYILDGHVVGKEYHSGIELKLRSLWDRLRQMLHW
jgi:hypothetical protein